MHIPHTLRAHLVQLHTIYVHAKRTLIGTNFRMKHSADKLRRDVQFKVGDKVWLDSRHFNLNTCRKLSARRLGPFEIIEKVNPVAYRLCLPKELSKKYNVFHVSLLSTFISPLPPPPLDDELSIPPPSNFGNTIPISDSSVNDVSSTPIPVDSNEEAVVEKLSDGSVVDKILCHKKGRGRNGPMFFNVKTISSGMNTFTSVPASYLFTYAPKALAEYFTSLRV
jgi:hypothetical protein